MSDEVSAVELLYYECDKDNPDMTKIDEYIIRCCNNKEDMNALFESYKWSPLHMTCWRGHHEILKRLLENSKNYKYPINVNINAIGDWYEYNESPLYLACLINCPLTVRTLLLHPAIEVNIGNSLNRTPLDVACWLGSKAVVLELLKHRSINLNVTDNNGATPLHNACFTNNDSASVVQLLLEHATIIDINATDNEGNTPLHIVCSSYNLNEEKKKIIRDLLKQPSIIIDKKNNNYEMPLEISKKKSVNDPSYAHDDIIQLFEDYHNQRRWQAICFLMIYD